MQDLEDRKIEFLGVSMPPRTAKSTTCIFFLSWIMGKRPNSHNAMSGHSGILADGFYGEIQNLISTPEYTFNEIFPSATLEKKSAEKKEVNLGAPDRFSTLTCRGIDGTWTGSVDISSDGYLYVDDLVRDRTESLSPTRLENRYQDCKNVCKLCNRLVISQAVAFTGGNLVITLPAGSYNNGEKYCIVIAQSIPETTTINAPVMIQIGTGTTLYPLQNRCCAQVTACGVRTRTKYATRVATNATGGVFKMLGNPACSPSNNLTAINGTAPTADTPVTQAVRKGAL